ncbi:ABA4-like family protein [Blastomonas sp.]|uniref:ABA4-like family protein n=1 Tax=Blastomonas sp. TaxID=1909299 RepID=UPI003593F872
MAWEQIFGIANLVALVAWGVLILAPRREIVVRALFFGPILLLALGYAAGLVLVLSGVVPTGGGGADFSTIAGVRSIFSSDAGVTIGWVHYLCFDLFVGLWIARNADAYGLNDLKGRLIQAPILIATFMAGPLGLAIYIVLRAVLLRTRSAHLIPT